MNTVNEKLLELHDLHTHFYTKQGVVKAVDDVNFSVAKGEVIGLVGESGCGKSITSLSILRMVPEPGGRIVSGKILFKSENLLEKSEEEMRQIRGDRISMIMQDPMVALNQLLKIGYQLGEPLKYHGKASGHIRNKCIELLKKVRVPSPQTRVNEYPFQFSGGMCQRAVIGMGISCAPDLLIADEPTTALDVTIQAQILRLLKNIRAEFNAAIIIITHDLALAAQICTRVLVMYAGKIIEKAPVKIFYENPAHPYSNGLIRSVPVVGRRVDRLYSIEGQPPSLRRRAAGLLRGVKRPWTDACRTILRKSSLARAIRLPVGCTQGSDVCSNLMI
jgi:oligopeptide/dipeptide ABC transporter ATP-binding protein